MTRLSSIVLACGLSVAAQAATVLPKDMVEIPAGKYTPFTSKSSNKQESKAAAEVQVDRFLLDRDLVSNERYLAFVKANPEWQRSKIKRLFADTHYLEKWKNDLEPPKVQAKAPVTYVSWFAASAFCESQGKRLPTTQEWEFALWDRGRDQEKLKSRILEWYSETNKKALTEVDRAKRNGYGAAGLGFVVWEWTSDFNAFLASSDTRDSKADGNLFCGNGSQMGDPADYPAFMRYSFRSSLKASYTTANLGFRCAKDAP